MAYMVIEFCKLTCILYINVDFGLEKWQVDMLYRRLYLFVGANVF